MVSSDIETEEFLHGTLRVDQSAPDHKEGLDGKNELHLCLIGELTVARREGTFAKICKN